MTTEQKPELLKRIPPITELLKTPRVLGWLETHPAGLVSECLRGGTAWLRRRITEEAGESLSLDQVTAEVVLDQAEELLARAATPNLRAAINATGIILHTGLGRAVFPGSVVDSMLAELKGYSTLAVDRARPRSLCRRPGPPGPASWRRHCY